MASRQCMVTPISASYRPKKNTGPCSRKDWEEQLRFEQEGIPMNWDGLAPTRGRMRPGDLFIAVYNPTFSRAGNVMIYPIIATHDPSHRLPTWANNIGQGDRRVLDLGNKLGELNWDTWLSLGGHKKVQGSQRVAHPEKIIAHIEALKINIHVDLLTHLKDEVYILSEMKGFGTLSEIQDRLVHIHKDIKRVL